MIKTFSVTVILTHELIRKRAIILADQDNWRGFEGTGPSYNTAVTRGEIITP